MIVANKQKWRKGITLLRISAWIRQQGWLRAIYRHFPSGPRNFISRALAHPSKRRITFRRTSRWILAKPRSPRVRDINGKDKSYPRGAGVNVFAYVRGQFGLAESARLYTRALLERGYPIALHDVALDLAHSMGDSSLADCISTEALHEINLVFVNPDCLEAALTSIGEEVFATKYTIGCWFWELENFPEAWLPALARVDEIFVASGFIAQMIRRVTDKPVFHVPLPIHKLPDSGLQRFDFGLRSEAYIFLTSFDFNSFLERKNPVATINAFRKAFPDGQDDVQLVVKSSNGHRHPDLLLKLLDVAKEDPRILIRDEVIEREHIQALQRCSDAYISLHRSEGFGLGLAECMHQGKPVIATAWSGNMEFMTADNSCLVDYTLVPVQEGEYLHHEGQYWAEPNIDHAAAYMRHLVEDRSFSEKIGRRAAIDINAKLSPQVIAEHIIERLEALRSSHFNDGGAILDAVNETR